MHHKINRTTTALVRMPVEESRICHRQRPMFRAPLFCITPVTRGTPGRQDNFQRDLTKLVCSPPEVISRHGGRPPPWSDPNRTHNRTHIKST
jgi:hypothetical protein